MIPSIAKIINTLHDRLDDMSIEQLTEIERAGDNTLLEISHLAELLSSQAQLLGDADCTAKPNDEQLSAILFSVAHTLSHVYEMLNLAEEASYKLALKTQKNPTK